MDGKRYFLFANPYKPDTITAAGRFAASLIHKNCDVFLDSWLHDELKLGEPLALARLSEAINAVVAFGGDGTLLRCLPLAASHKVPVLGINMGRAGFLLELDPLQLAGVTDRLILGDYLLEERTMLRCVLDDGFETLVMNDVAVSRGESPSSIAITAFADEEQIYKVHGDGILVASSTGTTGYALSAGGSVVHPELDSMSVVPICSHDLHLRPVVLPVSKTVRLSVQATPDRKHQISIDGQIVIYRGGNTKINVSKAEERIKFIRFSHQGFITRLHHKQRDWTQQTNGGGL